MNWLRTALLLVITTGSGTYNDAIMGSSEAEGLDRKLDDIVERKLGAMLLSKLGQMADRDVFHERVWKELTSRELKEVVRTSQRFGNGATRPHKDRDENDKRHLYPYITEMENQERLTKEFEDRISGRTGEKPRHKSDEPMTSENERGSNSPFSSFVNSYPPSFNPTKSRALIPSEVLPLKGPVSDKLETGHNDLRSEQADADPDSNKEGDALDNMKASDILKDFKKTVNRIQKQISPKESDNSPATTRILQDTKRLYGQIEQLEKQHVKMDEDFEALKSNFKDSLLYMANVINTLAKAVAENTKGIAELEHKFETVGSTTVSLEPQETSRPDTGDRPNIPGKRKDDTKERLVDGLINDNGSKSIDNDNLMKMTDTPNYTRGSQDLEDEKSNHGDVRMSDPVIGSDKSKDELSLQTNGIQNGATGFTDIGDEKVNDSEERGTNVNEAISKDEDILMERKGGDNVSGSVDETGENSDKRLVGSGSNGSASSTRHKNILTKRKGIVNITKGSLILDNESGKNSEEQLIDLGGSNSAPNTTNRDALIERNNSHNFTADIQDVGDLERAEGEGADVNASTATGESPSRITKSMTDNATSLQDLQNVNDEGGTLRDDGRGSNFKAHNLTGELESVETISAQNKTDGVPDFEAEDSFNRSVQVSGQSMKGNASNANSQNESVVGPMANAHKAKNDTEEEQRMGCECQKALEKLSQRLAILERSLKKDNETDDNNKLHGSDVSKILSGVPLTPDFLNKLENALAIGKTPDDGILPVGDEVLDFYITGKNISGNFTADTVPHVNISSNDEQLNRLLTLVNHYKSTFNSSSFSESEDKIPAEELRRLIENLSEKLVESSASPGLGDIRNMMQGFQRQNALVGVVGDLVKVVRNQEHEMSRMKTHIDKLDRQKEEKLSNKYLSSEPAASSDATVTNVSSEDFQNVSHGDEKLNSSKPDNSSKEYDEDDVVASNKTVLDLEKAVTGHILKLNETNYQVKNLLTDSLVEEKLSEIFTRLSFLENAVHELELHQSNNESRHDATNESDRLLTESGLGIDLKLTTFDDTDSILHPMKEGGNESLEKTDESLLALKALAENLDNAAKVLEDSVANSRNSDTNQHRLLNAATMMSTNMRKVSQALQDLNMGPMKDEIKRVAKFSEKNNRNMKDMSDNVINLYGGLEVRIGKYDQILSKLLSEHNTTNQELAKALMKLAELDTKLSILNSKPNFTTTMDKLISPSPFYQKVSPSSNDDNTENRHNSWNQTGQTFADELQNLTTTVSHHSSVINLLSKVLSKIVAENHPNTTTKPDILDSQSNFSEPLSLNESLQTTEIFPTLLSNTIESPNIYMQDANVIYNALVIFVSSLKCPKDLKDKQSENATITYVNKAQATTSSSTARELAPIMPDHELKESDYDSVPKHFTPLPLSPNTLDNNMEPIEILGERTDQDEQEIGSIRDATSQIFSEQQNAKDNKPGSKDFPSVLTQTVVPSSDAFSENLLETAKLTDRVNALEPAVKHIGEQTPDLGELSDRISHVEEAVRNVEEITRHIPELQTQLASIWAVLEDVDKNISALQNDSDRENLRLVSLENDSNMLVGDVAALHETVKGIDDALGELMTAHKDSTKKVLSNIVSLLTDTRKLETKVDKVEDENEANKRHRRDLSRQREKEKKELNEKLNAVENALERIEAKVAFVERTCEDTKINITALEQDLDHVKEDQDRLVENIPKNITALKFDIDALKDVVKNQGNKSDTMGSDLQRIKNETTALKSSTKRLEASVTFLEAQNGQLQNRVTALEKDGVITGNKVNTLEENVTEIKQKNSVAIGNLVKNMTSLLEDLQKQEELITILKKETKNHDDIAKEITEQIDKAVYLNKKLSTRVKFLESSTIKIQIGMHSIEIGHNITQNELGNLVNIQVPSLKISMQNVMDNVSYVMEKLEQFEDWMSKMANKTLKIEDQVTLALESINDLTRFDKQNGSRDGGLPLTYWFPSSERLYNETQDKARFLEEIPDPYQNISQYSAVLKSMSSARVDLEILTNLIITVAHKAEAIGEEVDDVKEETSTLLSESRRIARKVNGLAEELGLSENAPGNDTDSHNDTRPSPAVAGKEHTRLSNLQWLENICSESENRSKAVKARLDKLEKSALDRDRRIATLEANRNHIEDTTPYQEPADRLGGLVGKEVKDGQNEWLDMTSRLDKLESDVEDMSHALNSKIQALEKAQNISYRNVDMLDAKTNDLSRRINGVVTNVSKLHDLSGQTAQISTRRYLDLKLVDDQLSLSIKDLYRKFDEKILGHDQIRSSKLEADVKSLSKKMDLCCSGDSSMRFVAANSSTRGKSDLNRYAVDKQENDKKDKRPEIIVETSAALLYPKDLNTRLRIHFRKNFTEPPSVYASLSGLAMDPNSAKNHLYTFHIRYVKEIDKDGFLMRVNDGRNMAYSGYQWLQIEWLAIGK